MRESPATDASNEPLTDSTIAEVEADLGVVLPPTYLAFVRATNGTRLSAVVPCSGELPRSLSRYVSDGLVSVGGIAGIVPGMDDPTSITCSRAMRDEWGLPDGLVLLDGDGHTWLALDYRAAAVDPPVVLVVADLSDTVVVARSFGELWGAMLLSGLVYDRDGQLVERPSQPALVTIARELSLVLAAELHALRPAFANETVCAVALDLHPWHPVLEISILTSREVAADPLLASDDEQAAWLGFHATARDGVGLSRHRLAHALRTEWDLATGQEARRAVFAAGGEALGSEFVGAELRSWRRNAEIALFVSDPDDPRSENLVPTR
ncbi:MAG: SMI1/KNR4 family protein [Deltaproteobacteria bacterium]|nr:SMI1/KNR4 family protein [Deltaproteobacteria bacterium]